MRLYRPFPSLAGPAAGGVTMVYRISPVGKLILALALVVTIIGPVAACLWDYDTLLVERQRFPDTLELITGKFLRHSREYYQWRVEDREKRLQQEATPALYDDLSVAYEKLGNHDRAIALALEKEQQFPGRYETYANLGTFYIHAGDLNRGLQEIERAIALNPQAHFGREVYQKHLVTYVMSKRDEGEPPTLPLDNSNRQEPAAIGFAKHILEASSISDDGAQRDSELQRAFQGVLGMMRFGDYDSPILLEALGDLLLGRGYPDDAKRLAARAYLKASYEVETAEAREAYRAMAAQSLVLQTVAKNSTVELTLDALEKEFSGELAEASRWFDAVRRDEQQWIREGKNVDAMFRRKYYEEPAHASLPDRRSVSWPLVTFATLILVVTLWIICRVGAARFSGRIA
jgi:tetratricopeptide (TPR) repeat protein